jgi:hypothetical protein
MDGNLTFSGADANAPPGPTVPSAKELQAIGVIGLDIRGAGRVLLMNQIGSFLRIPPGGWHGQAKLFEGADVRLRALLTRLANEHQAKLIAANLDRAGRYTHVNIMLALVSAAREFDRSLTATGTKLIDSFNEGGLDFLWDEKDKLGLPRSVTKPWERILPFKNLESNREVHPARIPAHDQLLAYAAQIGASFNHNFQASLRAEFGPQAESALASASRLALLVWQAFAFLAPGGAKYDPKKPLRDQLGQHFGHRSALGLYAHKDRRKAEIPASTTS